jgi:hypothetical protein
MARRTAPVILLSFLVCGCSSDRTSDYGNYWKAVRESFANPFQPRSITLAQASEVSYASMGWRLDGGNQHLVILATDSHEDQLWTSSEHVVLMTHDGRLRRLVGLPREYSAHPEATGQNAEIPPPAAALQGPFSYRRSADFSDLKADGVPVTCRATSVGGRTIKILGKAIHVAQINENCSVPALHWQFTDTYWVSRDSGLVWRSSQHIHPDGQTLQTEIFRPPG